MPKPWIGQQKADADLRALTLMLAQVSNNALRALLRCNIQQSERLPLTHLRQEQEQSAIRIDYDGLGLLFKGRPQRVPAGNSHRNLQEHPLSSVPVQGKPLLLSERHQPSFQDSDLLLSSSRKQQAHAICPQMHNSGLRFTNVRSLADTQRCLRSERKRASRFHEAALLTYITDVGVGSDARLLVRDFNHCCEVVPRIVAAFSQANMTTRFWGFA